MIQLSVIIPVYNVAPYLSLCLESVLSCRSSEIEIVCVNDGSTDASGEILRAYAQKDSRLHVLEQENRGLSAARNAGVANSRGEFLLFVDSDDFVSTRGFAQFLERMSAYPSAEVFVLDYRVFYLQGGAMCQKAVNQVGAKHDGTAGMEFLPEMLRKRRCFWNVWRYVYRRSFLEAHGITFWEGVLSEDLDYTARVFLAEPRIVFLHCPFYYYRTKRPDSLMGQTTVRRIRDTVAMLAHSVSALAASKFHWKQLLIRQYQFEYILVLEQLYEIPEQDRAEAEQIFRRSLPLLRAGEDWLAHSVYGVCAAGGVRPFAFCLFVLRRIKRGTRRLAWAIQGRKG